MNTTITTIFFDIGNVLINFDHHRMWQNLATVSPLTADELDRRIQGRGLMQTFERGEISGEEFFHKAQDVGELDSQLSFQRFSTLWSDMFWEHPPIIQLAQQLQNHYTICLLSNTDIIHWDWLVERYPICAQVDDKILSFEVGAMKPESRIYQAAIQLSRSRPEQCVYLDDIGEYAAAACKLGMRGIQCQSPEQVQQEFRRLDIPV